MAVAQARPDLESRRILAASVASVLAWSFDLFDLFLLLFIAPTIGPLFFPSNSPTLSLAAVYASFAVTLLMRPVGSAIFGNYADKQGRKRAMVIAVFGVGLFTAALGVIPTIAQIGIAAPLLFILGRLIQGIFVGGVVASTHTIGTETVPQRYRGLLSGFIGAGAGIGGLFASLVFLIASHAFPGAAFAVWGWRVMFYTGLIGAALSFFVFRSVQESPLWAAQEPRRGGATRTPLKEVFSAQYRPIVFGNLAVTIGCGAMYYLTSGFLPTFLAQVNHLPKPAAGSILVWASIVTIIAPPITGHLSEFIGRKTTMLAIAIVDLIVFPICYNGLTHAGSFGTIVLFALVITILGNIAYSPVLVFLNERFPTAVRSSGTGLSWNIGFAAGGMMPTFVALASKNIAAIPTVLLIFLMAATALYLLGAAITPETRGHFV